MRRLGQCVLTAPSVFDQRDEDSIDVVLNEGPSADVHEDSGKPPRCARRWQSRCRTEASLIGDGSWRDIADPHYPMLGKARSPPENRFWHGFRCATMR